MEQQNGAAVRRDAPKDGLCGRLTAGQPCNIATGGTGRLGGAFGRWTLSAGPPLEALRRCAGFLEKPSLLPTELWGIQKGKADGGGRGPGSRRS